MPVDTSLMRRNKKNKINPILLLADHQQQSRSLIQHSTERHFLLQFEPLCIACLQNKTQATTFDSIMDWLDGLPSLVFKQVVHCLDQEMALSRDSRQTHTLALLVDACVPRYDFDQKYNTTETKQNRLRPRVTLAHVPHPGCTVPMFQRLHTILGMPLVTHMNTSTHLSSIHNGDDHVRTLLKVMPVRSAQRRFGKVVVNLDKRRKGAIEEHRKWMLSCLLGHSSQKITGEGMPRLASRLHLFQLFSKETSRTSDGLLAKILLDCQKSIVFAIREHLVNTIDKCPAIQRHMNNYVHYRAFAKTVHKACDAIRRRVRQELLPNGFLVATPGDTKESSSRVYTLMRSMDSELRPFHQAILNVGRDRFMFPFLISVDKMMGDIPPFSHLTDQPLVNEMNRRTNENKHTTAASALDDLGSLDPVEEPLSMSIDEKPEKEAACTGVSFEHCRILECLIQQFDPNKCTGDDMLTRVLVALPFCVKATIQGTRCGVTIQGVITLLELRMSWYKFKHTKEARLGMMSEFRSSYPYLYSVLQTLCQLWQKHTDIQRHELDYNTTYFQRLALSERYGCPIDRLPRLASQLWICSTCHCIWSPLRDEKQAGSKGTYGLRGAPIDGITDTAWCYFAKRLIHKCCRDRPLSALEGIGWQYFIERQAPVICPQKACGHWMVYDPAFCITTERGPACSGCTIKIISSGIKDARDSHPLGPGFVFSCFVCGKQVGKSTNTFIYGLNTMLCARHHTRSLKHYVIEHLEQKGIAVGFVDITDPNITRMCREAIIDFRHITRGKSNQGGSKEMKNAEWIFGKAFKDRNNAILRQLKRNESARKQRR